MNAPDLANDLLESTGVVGDAGEVEGDGLPEDRYSDRELSWLAFNNRVLDLAKDSQRVPLLERAKFLAIFANNLDEFFMVRVAGLKRRIAAGVAVRSVSGLMPREVHQAILTRTRELVDEHSRVFEEEIRPALAAEGIEILRWHELATDEKDRMRELFAERIFPVLTPLAVDPSHPFPYISGLSINLAVLVKNPVTGIRQFARVKVPSVLPRFVKLDEGRFVALEDVIARHLDQLFTGMQVVQHHVFRVTRNEDVEVEEDDAENLLVALERELLRRKVGRPPVRLEVEDDIDPKMLELLTTELDISEQGGLRAAGSARSARAVLADRPGPGGAEVPGLPARHAPAPGRGRDRPAGRHVRRPEAARRAAAPPVRLVRDQRHALHRAGRRRPAGAGHQADPLPHLGRLPHHRRPDRGGRAGQAGAGAGRDQGPLRRAGQHRLGPAAGAARLPRRLRAARSEDPLQAVDGGPRRARRAAPLRPHRHRQLQPEDGPALRGHGPADRQPDHHRRHRSVVQPHVRDESGDAVPPAAGRPARDPHRSARPDQQRDRQPGGREAGGHQDQGQLAGRRDRVATRCTGPRRPAYRWICGCAGSAPSGPGSRG